MNPIQQVEAGVRDAFPTAFIRVSPPAKANGGWSLDIKLGDKDFVVVQWMPGERIVVDASDDTADREWCFDEEHERDQALQRVLEVLNE